MARSARDGYAVRAQDLPGRLRVIGEVRAGEAFAGSVGPGEAVEIMTGAPVPAGADHVVMIEHTTRENGHVVVKQPGQPGENYNPQGVEARKDSVVLDAGQRITPSRIAQLAAVGVTSVAVYRRPIVAILSTGDEVIDIHATPSDQQVRNSNAWALAAQVIRSGAIPRILPVARDTIEDTRHGIATGLESDLLLLSGGVSAGKYDLVETVLAEFSAEFFFTRVKVQPGQPLVFGHAQGKFFFGLPGNPASTLVTFEVFAKLAVQLLSGETDPAPPFTRTTLLAPFTQKPGLTRILPAILSDAGLTPIAWKGSGDVPSLARANAFLVSDPARERYEVGEWIGVLPA
jgi:molybdopterin molybdotransferase